MPRALRVILEGGIYHVYNRVTRGERVFGDDEEAGRFVARMAEVKRRDDFLVMAWCLMSNHFHLAIRTGSTPLPRTMHSLLNWFARNFNGRHRVFGPLWQGRYKAKLVETEDYLRQLILYIHLNPIQAGVADEAAEYRWSGHHELVGGRKSAGLVDVDEALGAFGETRRAALNSYRRSLAAARDADWIGEEPGRLPWWWFGRPPRGGDEELLETDEGRPRTFTAGAEGVARARCEAARLHARGTGRLDAGGEGSRGAPDAHSSGR